jgi:hypothetical protein
VCFCFCVGVLTQRHALGRQVLYELIDGLRPFWFLYFSSSASHLGPCWPGPRCSYLCFPQGWDGSCVPPIPNFFLVEIGSWVFLAGLAMILSELQAYKCELLCWGSGSEKGNIMGHTEAAGGKSQCWVEFFPPDHSLSPILWKLTRIWDLGLLGPASAFSFQIHALHFCKWIHIIWEEEEALEMPLCGI